MKKRLVKPASQHQTERVSLYLYEMTPDCIDIGCPGGGPTDSGCYEDPGCDINSGSCWG